MRGKIPVAVQQIFELCAARGIRCATRKRRMRQNGAFSIAVITNAD
jgi:hypothetical protein